MKAHILKYTLVLLAGMLGQWWLFYFSPFPIPDRIPFTPFKTDGLMIVCYTIIILIFFLKGVLKRTPGMRLLQLTLLGALVCFLAEVIFQILRIPTLKAGTIGELLNYFLFGIIATSLFNSVLSFFIAFQLKTRRIKQLVLFIIAFVFIINIFLLWTS